MYKISEMAALTGLSRTALLYYEKLGLIRADRQANGYRIYSDMDLQRLRLIQKLQAGGLSLKEIRGCIDSQIDRKVLRKRLEELDREILGKQKSRDLLARLLGERPLTDWHASLDALAPQAHLRWLLAQGFSEKDALRLKWLSKDMNEHGEYMSDFMKVYDALERWGPGSSEDTLTALSMLPAAPQRILEIGCGKGLATRVLAEHSKAIISAVDNESTALEALELSLEGTGLKERIECICASMTELPFNDGAFDLIWAEGSAYIMGVANALREWRRFLSAKGVLVLSDLVWLVDEPSSAAAEFWEDEYPDISGISVRLRQMNESGFTVLHHFALSRQSWENYTIPLSERIRELEQNKTLGMAGSPVLADIARELKVYDQCLDRDFGYDFFILQKT
jgi:DNA-binding transcriptional MerR regulator/SAM-dependent methyltransferase